MVTINFTQKQRKDKSYEKRRIEGEGERILEKE